MKLAVLFFAVLINAAVADQAADNAAANQLPPHDMTPDFAARTTRVQSWGKILRMCNLRRIQCTFDATTGEVSIAN